MTEPFQRLKEAREKAGYATARDAAEAMGVKPPTYVHHENGTNGLSRSAERYARFFRVSLDWLLTGRGPREIETKCTIPLVGVVGAGSIIYPPDEDMSAGAVEYCESMDMSQLLAISVRGDSQYPRFLNGETILFEKDPRPLDQLIGRYAITDCADGRRLVKLLRRGSQKGLYRLESHNAPPEDDVQIVRAYRISAVLLR